jgi:hypothetical protein
MECGFFGRQGKVLPHSIGQKKVQSAVVQDRPEGEGQVAQEALVNHSTELKNEPPTAGFRFNQIATNNSSSILGFLFAGT